MTLALALTGVVFLVLALVMGTLAAEAHWKTAKACAKVGYAALGLAVVFFLASIWVHALT